jgi:hypothetical protein
MPPNCPIGSPNNDDARALLGHGISNLSKGPSLKTPTIAET